MFPLLTKPGIHDRCLFLRFLFEMSDGECPLLPSQPQPSWAEVTLKEEARSQAGTIASSIHFQAPASPDAVCFMCVLFYCSRSAGRSLWRG